jgi:hypothetical protein
MGLKSSKLADLYWKQPHLNIAFAGQKYIYLRIPICSSSRKRCMCQRNAEEFHQYHTNTNETKDPAKEGDCHN